jgi:hypothetical protein
MDSNLSQVKTKDYKISICFFYVKHAALRRKSKDWLAWNRDNVSKWSVMYTNRLLPQTGSFNSQFVVSLQAFLLIYESGTADLDESDNAHQ